MRRERSAGGVVIRGRDEGRELVVVTPRTGVLALPKGHPEAGESLEQAAAREVREETGVVAEVVGELGEVRYWYTLRGVRVLKSVAFFLFSYRSGDVSDHDEEVESAEWIDLESAPSRLSYRGEREMAARALARKPAGGECT